MMELLAPGIDLLLIGLGTVFSFLAVLIGTIALISAAVRRYETRHPQPPTAAAATDAAHVAAITAAIHRFRQPR